MALSNFLSENKGAIAFTLALLLLGTAVYFSQGAPGALSMGQLAGIYPGMGIKAAFLPSGEIKLFAQASQQKLSALRAAEGSNLPTDVAMVIGSGEAAMMRNEKLISGTGSSLEGFFGINTSVAGILGKTGGPLDMMHFLSEKQFNEIQGEEGKVKVLLKGTMPKIFFYYEKGEDVPRMALAEGNAGDYSASEINGKVYFPMLIGSDEAKMMRDEKLFSQPGDTLDGFFGANVRVAGVLAKTNSTLDMMHFVPRESGIGN